MIRVAQPVVFVLLAVAHIGCAPREQNARPEIVVHVQQNEQPVEGARVVACTNRERRLEHGCERRDVEETDASGTVVLESYEDSQWGLWCPIDLNESYTVIVACKGDRVDAATVFGAEDQEITVVLGGMGVMEVEEIGLRRATQFEDSDIQRVIANVCDLE